jgi:hypothetical protein
LGREIRADDHISDQYLSGLMNAGVKGFAVQGQFVELMIRRPGSSRCIMY